MGQHTPIEINEKDYEVAVANWNSFTKATKISIYFIVAVLIILAAAFVPWG